MRRRDTGGRIDRSRPITFSFNGKPCLGFGGDTLASALLANGISIVGRGPKQNRPRGIMGSGLSDQSGFVTLEGRKGNRIVLAAQIELYEGLVANSVLPWPLPSLVDRVRGDRSKQQSIEFSHSPVQAGYTSESSFAHCDVLIIGSGPAGLMAALTAGQAGARVMVVEQAPVLGGSLCWCPASIDEGSSDTWLAKTEQALHRMPDVRTLTRSIATGIDNQGKVVLFRTRPDDPRMGEDASGTRLQVWKVTAQQVILASGAVERPLVFPQNNSVGVMLTSAMLDYARQFAVTPVQGPIVVATNNDRGIQSAKDLFDEGVPVTTVVDFRNQIQSEIIGPLCDRGIDLIGGHAITAVDSETGISRIELAPWSNGKIGSDHLTLKCGGLAVSGGWNPRLEVLQQAGGTIEYDEAMSCLAPRSLGSISLIAGAVSGDISLANALRSGQKAGYQAAKTLEFDGSTAGDVPDSNGADSSLNIKPCWSLPQSGIGQKARQWVDFRHDLTVSDVNGETSTGGDVYIGPIEDKQLIAPSPGATFDFVTMNVDKEIEPPRRVLPVHPWHVEHGAAFRQTHGWLRPAFFTSNGGSAEDAISAEMKASRQTAAISDLSAAGKIEIDGSDSATFLDRVFCTPLDDLAVGHLRYCEMLDDSGSIIDQCTAARLGEDRFMLTVSPGTTRPVTEWLESWHSSEFSTAKVFITPVTSQWATIALSGPRARQVFLELDRDIDISTEAFPFLALREGTVCGAPALVMRTSHTGEVTFEISVPADFGASLWQLAVAAGTRLGIRAVGEDALKRLAAEKGRIDIPGLAPGALTPMDIDLTGEFKPKAADFVGKNALLRPSAGVRERLQLVALRSEDNATVLPNNGTVIQGDSADEIRQGRIAASFYSDVLGNPMALALVLEGHKHIGDTVRVLANGQSVPARIVKPVIFDPNGRRRYG